MHAALPSIGHIPPVGSPRRRIAARGVSRGIYQANRKHRGKAFYQPRIDKEFIRIYLPIILGDIYQTKRTYKGLGRRLF